MIIIPIGDENRRNSSTPYVVYILIAINIAVFAYEWFLEQNYGQPVLQRFIYDFGAVPAQILGVFPKPVGLFTSMFLHADIMHLFGNMFFLWIFADNIEDSLGVVKFTAFYILCGLIAGIASVLVRSGSLDLNIPGIGASGAIAGVLGAYFTLFPRNRIRTFYWVFFIWMGTADVAAIWYLGIWVLWQFIFQGISSAAGSVGGVDYMAHLAGFIAGIVFISLFPKRGKTVLARKR